MANPYRIQLLNDLHTYFPELLYNHQRFQSTSDVLGYVNYVARSHGQNYDPYGYYSRMHRAHEEEEYPQRRQRSRPNPPSVAIPPSPDLSVDDEPNIVVEFRSYMPAGGNLSSLFSHLIGDSFSQHLHDLLDDVPIIPTDEQLRNNTIVATLTEDKSDNCAICQDPLLKDQVTRTINHCHHMFHQSCVDQWFQRNIHCSNCRHDIRL